MKTPKTRKTVFGNLVIKDGQHKTVIITNPKSAARYMKRTAIVIQPSPLGRAEIKIAEFLHSKAGKVTMISALAAIGAGAGAITVLQIRRANKLRKVCNTIINDAADSVDFSDVCDLDEFIGVMTTYVASHPAYISFPNRDKMAIFNLIRRTASKMWVNREDDDVTCDCDDCDDDFEDDDFDDDDDEVIVEPPTKEEMAAPVTVEVAKTETEVVAKPAEPSQVDKFNERLEKSKQKQQDK